MGEKIINSTVFELPRKFLGEHNTFARECKSIGINFYAHFTIYQQ